MKRIMTVLLLIGFVLGSPGRKEFSDAFIKVANKANPAVVTITSEKMVKNDFHRFFFYPRPDDPDRGEYPSETMGSGVIIDAQKGYIVTNNHVVDEAEEINVLLMDQRELEAEVIGTDPLSDIALLRVDAKELTAVRTGNSDDLEIGEWVVAIGSPFQLSLNHTVTAGIVSAKGRSDVLSRRNFENFIQHDAAINPGNSGGALLNLDGELVGINTAIATDGWSRASAGVGFAVPINQVMRVIEDLIEFGSVSRGWLGVTIQDIDERMARALDLETRKGAIIAQVLEDSPASKSDLEEQDIILEVNGVFVEDASHLKNLVATGHPGEKMRFTVVRENREKVIVVKLGERPGEDELNYASRQDNRFDKLGLRVDNLDERSARHLNLDPTEGVLVVDVEEYSAAAKAGIREGDIIITMDKKPVDSIKRYRDILGDLDEGDTVLFLIKRDGNSRFVAVEIE